MNIIEINIEDTRKTNERLRDARIEFGFKTAAAFARKIGVSTPTYAGHENGSRGFNTNQATYYAEALNVDPVWLVFGRHGEPVSLSGVSLGTLEKVLRKVLTHPVEKDAEPRDISELVIEICEFISKSGPPSPRLRKLCRK